MSDAQWDNLVDLIDQKFTISKHAKTSQPIEGSHGLENKLDTIFFAKAGQEYKIVRTTSPAVTDTKTHYARAGVASRVEKHYDSSELTHRVNFYRAQGTDWVEVSPEQLMAESA